jgi:hypothetical protein
MLELKNILEKRGFKVYNDKRENEWWLEKQDPMVNGVLKIRIARVQHPKTLEWEWSVQLQAPFRAEIKEYSKNKNKIISFLKDDKNFKNI